MDENPALQPIELSWRNAPVLLADRLGVTPYGVVVGLLAIVAAAATAWFALRPPAIPAPEALPLAASTPITGAQPAVTTPALVVVHVAGAVVRPGVHELDSGSRVIDAIAAAGGLTAAADHRRLNLALVVTDQQRLWVPAVGEEIPVAVVPSGADPTGTGSDGGGVVDVNRAGSAELEALPGIGPSLAAAIIDHREREGPFSSIDSLLDVTGIGPAKLDQIRSLVAV